MELDQRTRVRSPADSIHMDRCIVGGQRKRARSCHEFRAVTLRDSSTAHLVLLATQVVWIFSQQSSAWRVRWINHCHNSLARTRKMGCSAGHLAGSLGE